MRRPLASAALRLRLRCFSSSSPTRLLSPCPLLLSRRDDDDGREGPSSPQPPLPPGSTFSPRPLLFSASAAAGLLSLRGGWWRRALPPAASRPPGAVADAAPVRLTISRSKEGLAPSFIPPLCLLFFYLFSSCLMLGAATFLMQVILCVWLRARRRHILTMSTGNFPSLISLRSHILTMDLRTLNISLRSQNITPVKQISEVVFTSWIIVTHCFHAKSN